jgi:hypothetical protein
MVEDIKFWVARHQLTYLSPSRDNVTELASSAIPPTAGRRLFCERCLPERSDS